MVLLLGILLGGLFGFALYYVGAANSKKLINMLNLQDLSLMKIILFAIGFSSVLLSIATFLGIFDISHLSIKTTHLGVIVGGLIFGIGFGWAGTCPGTCAAATTSEDSKKAISAVIGGLLGAFLFSLSYGFLKDLGLFQAMNLGKLTLFNISVKYPSVLQIGFTGLFVMGLLIMLVAVLLPTTPFLSSERKSEKHSVSR
jgi:hypothetical protein